MKLEPYYQRKGAALYHGDALVILPQLPYSGLIGAVVTDPPYSSGGQFRGDRCGQTTTEKYVQTGTLAYRPQFSGDNRDQRGYLKWCSIWMAQARALCLPGSVLATFSDWRQLPTTTDAAQAGGWTWRGLATWWKPGCRMQQGTFSHSAEYVVHATNGPAKRNRAGGIQNVFACPPVREREHVAQKPLKVMDWALTPASHHCTILDPFAGLGTTMVSALASGRDCVGIELDERYCEATAKRLDHWLEGGDPEDLENLDLEALFNLPDPRPHPHPDPPDHPDQTDPPDAPRAQEGGPEARP